MPVKTYDQPIFIGTNTDEICILVDSKGIPIWILVHNPNAVSADVFRKLRPVDKEQVSAATAPNTGVLSEITFNARLPGESILSGFPSENLQSMWAINCALSLAVGD